MEIGPCKKYGRAAKFLKPAKFRRLRIFATCKNSRVEKLSPTKIRRLRNCLLMPLFTLLTAPSCCPFDLLTYVPLFGFLPILSPVIDFDFGSFCNFSWQGQYISSYYTVTRDNFLHINKFDGKLSTLPVFSHFLSFSLIFLATKHPPRMTTRRMSG